MKSQSELPILLLGLQDSGKSNFILGLDVVLADLADPDGLVHSELAEDRSYVQPLREQWLKGEELPRTSAQMEPQLHQLIVKHPASGKRVSFHIPDQAGESFSAAFVSRSFSTAFYERLRVAQGLLVFIHANDNADHELHGEALYCEVTPTKVNPEVGNPPSALDFDPIVAAKQIKLVDLLQFVDEAREGCPALRVSVIVSAWDQVLNAPAGARSDMPLDPVLFVRKRWPLLRQFLESNSDRFVSQIYGVSARGGSGTAEDLDKMLAHTRPADRVVVVDGVHQSSDITRPVRWALGLLNSNSLSNTP